ncbi:MAG TPA: ATP-binding protein [Chloroflexota bacterium]|nr:ATP-binding protein [Chloroflexota bacterium]
MRGDLHYRYTDVPPLPKSLFLGSARLLFWLFFHPAAWRNHLARLDMRLPADFCLADLDGRHWRSLAVWRFLIQTYLAWPALVALALIFLLMAWRLPTAVIFFGVMSGVTFGIMASLAASLAGSVAIGVTIGIATGLAVGLGGGLIFYTPAGLEINGVPYEQEMVVAVLIGLMSGLAGGLAYGVGMGLTREKREEASFSLLRQVSGVVIGIMIGVGAGQLAALAQNDWLAGVASGVLFGTAVGWRTNNRRRGLSAGLILGGIVGVSGLLAGAGIVGSSIQIISLVAFVAATFALPYALAEKIAGTWAAGLAGALGGGAGLFLFASGSAPFGPFLWFSLAGMLLGLTLAWWRPVLMYPLLLAWNGLLYRLDERRLAGDAAGSGASPVFHYHSAFWDEFQRLPLLNLDDYLLFVLQNDTAEARTAMAYLSGTRQRWAAQSAQIEMDARQLAQCGSAAAIAAVHPGLATSDLTGPASALLRSFSRVSSDVAAALQQESAYNKRLALHAVEDRLDGLLRELTRSNEPYAARFRPIAAEWRRIIGQEEQLLAAEAELRQEIDSPYIIGVPLTEKQEIFIGRTDVSGRIEQLLRDRRQPPLLLYGQRRVGKTSLLNNLGRLLPGSIVPMFVDLQGPASRAQDEAGFLYNVGRGMAQSAQRQRGVELPPLTREMLADDPFTQFDEWLDAVEGALGDQLALLMLDEFEVLERVLERERFDPEIVLGMLRHLIQHRPKFKVLLSGSHTLDEFQRWSSYLINVQVIHIGYLNEAEARQLIETPVKGFALRYEPSAGHRVLELTRGHPFLVQLLCAEIVALKNEQPPLQRRLATVDDVETAVPEALQHGSFFFADIKQNQVDTAGLAALQTLAAAGEGAQLTLAELGGDGLADTLRGLCHREIVELVDGRADGRYRFQIELVRRWLALN